MNNIDKLTEQIRNEGIDPAIVEAAGERVSRTLFGPGAAGVDRIQGCDDFRSLIPAYLQRTLSDARRLLLEDHARECVACRKAITQARGGEKVMSMPVRAYRPTTNRWAIAAAAVVSIGLTGALAMRYVAPDAIGGPRATVTAVHGLLYRVSDTGSLPVGEGQQIGDGEEIRTGRDATAVVTLLDGSRVEMNERAELSVTRGWRGTTIRLDRGHIIVQAAKQKQGRLYVATGDAQVSVKGTIFSVNRGTMGSRVSVVEGEVEVQHGSQTESLKPGGQTATSPAITPLPVAQEIAWSADAPRYLALLGEFNALQKGFATIPGAALRYNSRLLVYVPQDAYLFTSIPNMKVTLTDAKKIFDDRLAQSQVLRDWWNAPENVKMRDEVESLIQNLQELSGYLGEEMVLTVSGSGTQSTPVMMAEVTDTKVQGFLDQLLKKAGAKPFVYAIQKNILLVSATAAGLQTAQAIVAKGGAPDTPFRQRIQQAYTSGAGMLVCASMEQILARSVNSNVPHKMPTELGFQNVQFLVLERRDVANQTENRAALTFNGQRQGLAAWLAAPGPLSTLDFVSPDAGMAMAMVVQTPRALVQEIFDSIRQRDPNFDAQLAQFQMLTGLNIMDDLAAPLGSEGTFALDGPILPIPSWKVALEVNAPQRLQASIVKLVQAANSDPQHNLGTVTLSTTTLNGRVFYEIKSSTRPVDINYTFVDSFVLAAPNRTLLTQAIQNRQTGFTLAHSDRFRSAMPTAASPNFSGVLYHNMGNILGPAVDAFKDTNAVTPAQRQSMLLLKDTPPGLIAAYGEPDRILLASNGTFLGFNATMLAGLQPLFQHQK